MTRIEIRTYRPADHEPLRAILFGAFEAGELQGSTRLDVERWHDRLPGDPDATIVATLDGDVAGLMTPAHDHLVVGARVRRRGVGRALVAAALARNAERGAGPLFLALPRDSDGARAFFAAIGFVYHHSLWQMRLRDDAVVPPPGFPPTVVRRPYQPADLVPFVELVNAAFQDHPTPFALSVDQIRFVHDLPSFDPDNLCLLAPADDPGHLIAFCRSIREENAGVITILGVRRAWRGQGLARQLLRWGIQRALETGAEIVWLAVEGENDRALRLYESEGFARAQEWPRYGPAPSSPGRGVHA